jgi:hypothetical protein
VQFSPESTAITVNARFLSGAADVLTREASDNGVNVTASLSNKFACNFSDIFKPRNVRPVFRQHSPAEWINLGLSGAFPTRAL